MPVSAQHPVMRVPPELPSPLLHITSAQPGPSSPHPQPASTCPLRCLVLAPTYSMAKRETKSARGRGLPSVSCRPLVPGLNLSSGTCWSRGTMDIERANISSHLVLSTVKRQDQRARTEDGKGSPLGGLCGQVAGPCRVRRSQRRGPEGHKDVPSRGRGQQAPRQK